MTRVVKLMTKHVIGTWVISVILLACGYQYYYQTAGKNN